MKYQLILFFLFSVNLTFGQKEIEVSKNYIRIYNLQGKKIAKGKIVSIYTDSIKVYSKRKIISILLTDIGKIKTKRSTGNIIGRTALIGGGSLGVVSLVKHRNSSGGMFFSSREIAAGGFVISSVIGGVIGGGIGGIRAIFKKSKCYIINGDQTRLLDFRKELMVAD